MVSIHNLTKLSPKPCRCVISFDSHFTEKATDAWKCWVTCTRHTSNWWQSWDSVQVCDVQPVPLSIWGLLHAILLVGARSLLRFCTMGWVLARARRACKNTVPARLPKGGEKRELTENLGSGQRVERSRWVGCFGDVWEKESQEMGGKAESWVQGCSLLISTLLSCVFE